MKKRKIIISFCKLCNKKVVDFRERKFCNYECMYEYRKIYSEETPMYGKKHSKESKKRMSEKAKERKGEKNSFYGKHHTEKARKRIGEKNKGKKRRFSLESRKRMSEKAKERYKNKEDHPMYGRKQSEETVRKRIEKTKGKRRSLETRKRMSEKAKERYKNDENHPWKKKENRKKASKNRRGKKHSLETRKRISISASNRTTQRYISGYFYSEKMQKEILYQSSLELRALEMFEKDNNIWSIERYNLGPIKYKMNGSYHSYNPDYFLNEKIVYEVKPTVFLTKLDYERNLAKIKAAKKYCKKKGFEFKVLTEKDL